MSSNLLYHHSFSIMELCFPHRCVGLVPINVRIINMVYSPDGGGAVRTDGSPNRPTKTILTGSILGLFFIFIF